jgi:CTP synthase
MQTACIEFAKNVCGLSDANSTEFREDCENPIIFKLRDLVDVEELGGTMRLGAWDCNLKENSLAREIYNGTEQISERHRHRFEFNPEYRNLLEENGLIFSGISPNKKFVEIIELPKETHPFFVGCQFHPEYKSKPLDAHPLFVSFVKAAWQNRIKSENLKEDVSSDTPYNKVPIEIKEKAASNTDE